LDGNPNETKHELRSVNFLTCFPLAVFQGWKAMMETNLVIIEVGCGEDIATMTRPIHTG